MPPSLVTLTTFQSSISNTTRRETKAFTNMMKSSLVLMAILSIVVLTTVTQVKTAKCGSLSTGKRINRCRKAALKNKARALLMRLAMKMERNYQSIVSS